MTVPSKEQFESFFDTAKWNMPQEWERVSFSITPEEVEPFLLKVIKERTIIRDAIYAHPVAEWFFEQENIKHAYRYIRGRHKKQSVEDESKNLAPQQSAEDEAKNLAQMLLVDATPDRYDFNWHLSISCCWQIANRPESFNVETLKAFFHYHHTDRWVKVANIGRNASNIMDEYLRAIQRLKEAIADAELLNEFDHGMRPLHIHKGLNRSLDFQKKNLMKCITDNSLLLPTCRADDKAKERVLVYDLVKVFQSRRRKPKSRAIAAMLMTEGVKNPLDQRTVERLIKEWRTRKQEIDTVIANSEEGKENTARIEASVQEYRRLHPRK